MRKGAVFGRQTMPKPPLQRDQPKHPWEKGDRSNLPERPGGCFAQIGPVPFFQDHASLFRIRLSAEDKRDNLKFPRRSVKKDKLSLGSYPSGISMGNPRSCCHVSESVWQSGMPIEEKLEKE